MTNFSTEMIEKAKSAAAPEELLALAEANGIELSADEAAAYFAQLNPKTGELEDDELEMVSGGGCGSSNKSSTTATRYGYDLNATNKVHFSDFCPECRQVRYINGLWDYGHRCYDGYLYWVDRSADKWEIKCKDYHLIGSHTGDPADYGVQKGNW